MEGFGETHLKNSLEALLEQRGLHSDRREGKTLVDEHTGGDMAPWLVTVVIFLTWFYVKGINSVAVVLDAHWALSTTEPETWRSRAFL